MDAGDDRAGQRGIYRVGGVRVLRVPDRVVSGGQLPEATRCRNFLVPRYGARTWNGPKKPQFGPRRNTPTTIKRIQSQKPD